MSFSSINYEFCQIALSTVNSQLVIGSNNQFHNILRLFDVLPNFPITASETMCDNYL